MMVVFSGDVSSVSHEIDQNGLGYYFFTISNTRTSGIVDTIPCRMSDKVGSIKQGFFLVKGDLRTYRYEVQDLVHSVTEIWVTEFEEYKEGNYVNLVDATVTVNYIGGLRTTPSGREILDVGLVRRRSTGKTDKIPGIFWSSGAKAFKKYSTPGQEIVVHGRLQSRTYEKQNIDETFRVVEISVSSWEVSIPDTVSYM